MKAEAEAKATEEAKLKAEGNAKAAEAKAAEEAKAVEEARLKAETDLKAIVPQNNEIEIIGGVASDDEEEIKNTKEITNNEEVTEGEAAIQVKVDAAFKDQYLELDNKLTSVYKLQKLGR